MEKFREEKKIKEEEILKQKLRKVLKFVKLMNRNNR